MFLSVFGRWFLSFDGLGSRDEVLTGSSKCKKCGTEVYAPVKKWSVKPKSRRNRPLLVTLYECPKCFHRWKVYEVEKR
jgi:DNA-directed RNA polymerase subunit M/transcription elongation factor TFIIS